MTSPDFDDQRDLAGSDKYLENLLTTMDTDQCVGVPFIVPDFDQTAYVVIPLTGNEIARLVSVIDVGAALLYPDAYHEIYYSFVKGLECSVLCDTIVSECLSNDGFRQSLIVALAATNALTETAGSDTVDEQFAATVLIDFGEGCDDEDRYGGAYEMVNLLNTASNDILDIISAVTGQVEVAKKLAENIPIIGNVAALALEAAQLAVDVWIDLYTAAYNSTSHDELACAVFCEIDGCEMTLEQVINAYTDILGVDLPSPPAIFPTNFNDVVLWLVDVAEDLLTDVQIVASFHWLILQVLARGSKWTSTTTRILQIALSIYSPLEPPETCECATWTHEFLNTEDGISFFTLMDVEPSLPTLYNATEDRLEGRLSGAYWAVYTINLPSERTITGLTVYQSTSPQTGDPTDDKFQVYKDGSYLDGELVYETDNEGGDVTKSISESVRTATIGIQQWVGNLSPETGYLYVTRIVMSGNGSDPFA